MARTDPQINLRIPAELKSMIDAAADESGRSMNAEVVARLQQSFKPKSDALGLIVAGTLGGLLETIPEAERSERINAGIRFAHGIISGDAQSMAESLAKLVIDPSRPVSEQGEFAQGAASFQASVLARNKAAGVRSK